MWAEGLGLRRCNRVRSRGSSGYPLAQSGATVDFGKHRSSCPQKRANGSDAALAATVIPFLDEPSKSR
jgi:hypothetical protein